MADERRTHMILNRPVLGTLLLMGFVMLVMFVPQTIGMLLGWDDTVFGYLFTIAAIAPMLFVTECVFTKVWFRGEFDGTLGRDRVIDGLKMTIPLFVLNTTLFLAERLFLAPSEPMNNVLMVLSLALNAGFMEEAWFRSYTVANLMRVKRSYGGMIFAVLLTSFLFGLSHLSNVMMGADLSRTIQQFLTSAIAGLFYTAIYLRCGTILPCMLYHSFHDIINLLFLATNSSGAMVKAATTSDLIAQILFSGLELGLALWLLRPAVFEEVRELWDRKWHLQPQGSADTHVACD